MSERQDVQEILAQGGERFTDHLELLAAMSQDFAASGDIRKTLSKALMRITDYMDAEGGALFLLEDKGTVLRCTASVGPVDLMGLSLQAGEGIVGRCVQSNAAEIVRDVSKDPNFFSGADEKTGFRTRSLLCAPMMVRDEKIGAIEVVNKRSRDGLFDNTDLHLLQVLSSSAALALINARMAEALVEQERVRREMELAAEIQRSLLPGSKEPSFPVRGINIPARTVSGDFYDFFELPDGKVCFCLGDVSGKGMNAALLMAKTASLFRALGKTSPEPGMLLARINAEVCETATRGMFVTMVAGVYDPATGELVLSNAGHEPPLIHRGGGMFESIEAEAPPLGVMPLGPGEDFPETSFQLGKNTLYVFTDGVTEGYGKDGKPLEIEGLKSILAENDDIEMQDRLETVVDILYDPGKPLRDDITIMAIEGRIREEGQYRRESSYEGEQLLSFTFYSKPDQLKCVRMKVTEAVSACGCVGTTIQDFVIAVDEACQNIIRHAYQGKPDGKIILEIYLENGDIVVLLRDFANTVNPDLIRPRDLGDIRPGGLGTHLMREVMDEITFLPPPQDKGNLLRMKKRII
ncbi:MAG: SpoIIE family protein phosphatase [Rhodospirillales bacterium]